jgi:hypothetical protein
MQLRLTQNTALALLYGYVTNKNPGFEVYRNTKGYKTGNRDTYNSKTISQQVPVSLVRDLASLLENWFTDLSFYKVL